MRLLITTGVFPPEVGGPATYVDSFARWAAARGHRVTVAAALISEPSGELPFRLLGIPKKNGTAGWHVGAFRRICNEAKNCDVIYANGLFPESAAVARFQRKRIVFRVPGDDVWERARRRGWSGCGFLDFQCDKGNLPVRILRAIRRWYLNRADCVIAPSFFLSGIIAGWGVPKNKIAVIHNPYSPVDPEPFPLSENVTGRFTIATGGRLIPLKNIDLLMKVVRELKDAFLIVFGDGPEKGRLIELAHGLGISGRVLFTGEITRGRVSSILSQSSVFVLPSAIENFPHVIIEAMAAGCPVVASHVGGIPEIIEDGKDGILVDGSDMPGLRDAIRRLLADHSLRDTISRNARLHVKEHFDANARFADAEDALQGNSGVVS